jgi:hypothetical protein
MLRPLYDHRALASQGFLPDDVFAHPRHEAAHKALPDPIIVQLRAAGGVAYVALVIGGSWFRISALLLIARLVPRRPRAAR